MGFDLYFMRVNGQETYDADRAGLAAFLDRHRLHQVPDLSTAVMVDQSGAPLSFEGYQSELYLNLLDQSEPVTGNINHATLSDEETVFIYDLCVAGGFVIVNPQGEPDNLVPGGVFDSSFVSPYGSTAWVNSAAELQEALSGNFERFLEYRRQIISPTPDEE
ncbi:hypothetical protein [Galactobacter caseinivorans]|uniref:Uncharacterized protein n=1 Tax=Galactobacter caseinivorans TaxID=2676123 RepID=A0A496PIZ4_9MICC|nr:hypothetical protein [Galactobacter caseinivorans]RKW70463.1 hypothetical protein DWQ67_08265 [Galactobacter caseinivorans]